MRPKTWKGNMEGKRFYHISTDEVYGSLGAEGLFTETTSYDPNSPYSASKASSDHFVRAYGETYGLPYVITNCSNNYGPYQFPEKLIPHMILNALEGKPLPIYGDGSQTRSFCYVDDLVDGIVKLLYSDEHLPVNIGNPHEISIKDFAEEIIKLTGTSQKVIYKELPVNDPMQRQPDISLAKKLLNWQPKVGREEGMKITFDYFKGLTQEELYKSEHRDFEKHIKKTT